MTLLWLLGTSCATGDGDDPGTRCSVGERSIDGTCETVRSLQVNVDERLDVREASARRGIGAFACTLEPLAHAPKDASGDCVLFQFKGELIADGFFGDGGGINIGLDEPVTMVPDASSSCYASDLFPSRDNLYGAHEPFQIRGSGGDDFPAFSAVVVGPETLAVDEISEISRSSDLTVRWLSSSADVMLFVVNTFDVDTDDSARIVCVFDDEPGEGLVPATLLAGLLPSDDEGALTFLRQNITHIEPTDADVAVDLIATSSVVQTVSLVD